MRFGGAAFGSETGGLFLAEQGGECLDFEFEPGGALVCGGEAVFHFLLADGEDVGLHFEVLALAGEGLAAGAGFELGAAAGVVHALQPEGFGGVEHRLGGAVQGSEAGVQAAREATPPMVEQRVDGVRGTAADLETHLFDRGALTLAQQAVGGAIDIGGGDAAGGGGCGRGRALRQQSCCCWIGGHFTEPNEQNTQQSPGFGRSSAWHRVHS